MPAGFTKRKTKTWGILQGIGQAGNCCYRDVFLHEATTPTTPPFFKGPATKALYALGVEYKDISYIAWAYEQDVPHTSFEWGHAADVAPSSPCTARLFRFCLRT